MPTDTTLTEDVAATDSRRQRIDHLQRRVDDLFNPEGEYLMRIRGLVHAVQALSTEISVDSSALTLERQEELNDRIDRLLFVVDCLTAPHGLTVG